METTQLLVAIVTGGVLGMMGQGIRFIIGMGKEDPNKPVMAGKLSQGLVIGFIAGALAMLIKAPKAEEMTIANRELWFTIVAAGYAGADFIEGIFNTLKNKLNASQTPPAVVPLEKDGAVKK
ncbi:hypothetical protein [Flavobacterium wongokense]|uniref:hypothetical protein n=1 Tax=Flavobacterium wongokense TaxID=2910674 RepID=UPI001F4245C5|nr:hypothetical protein [Flavobacterium sp. WG47]MCF6130902.1 hypothetical protein [Flavobacterium sp. WG47]